MKAVNLAASTVEAYECGIAAGRNDVTLGEIFRSAMPAAESYGYAAGTAEFDAFVKGYLGVCNVRFPDGVPTDVDGRIAARPAACDGDCFPEKGDGTNYTGLVA